MASVSITAEFGFRSTGTEVLTTGSSAHCGTCVSNSNMSGLPPPALGAADKYWNSCTAISDSTATQTYTVTSGTPGDTYATVYLGIKNGAFPAGFTLTVYDQDDNKLDATVTGLAPDSELGTQPGWFGITGDTPEVTLSMTVQSDLSAYVPYIRLSIPNNGTDRMAKFVFHPGTGALVSNWSIGPQYLIVSSASREACLSGDTTVWLADGQCRRIDTLVHRDESALLLRAVDGNGDRINVPCKVVSFAHARKSKLYHLRGRGDIGVSDWHLLLFPTDKEVPLTRECHKCKGEGTACDRCKSVTVRDHVSLIACDMMETDSVYAEEGEHAWYHVVPDSIEHMSTCAFLVGDGTVLSEFLRSDARELCEQKRVFKIT